MFKDDKNLIDLNISSLKTTLPVDLTGTFNNCTSLVELNLENFHIPNSHEASFEETFYRCTNLRKLNIKNINTGAPEYDDMLAKLPSLNTLVLGKNTDLTTVYSDDIANIDDPNTHVENVGLDTEGIWLNIGNGTTIRPEGTEQYTSEQLMAARATIHGSNQRNFTKAEIYVRMGLPITIHHVDESGKQIAEDTIFPGNFGDPYSIIGDPYFKRRTSPLLPVFMIMMRTKSGNLLSPTLKILNRPLLSEEKMSLFIIKMNKAGLLHLMKF